MEKLEKFIIKNLSTCLIVIGCIIGVLLIRGCSKQNKIESLQNKIEANNSTSKTVIDSLSNVIKNKDIDLDNKEDDINYLKGRMKNDSAIITNLQKIIKDQANKPFIVNNKI